MKACDPTAEEPLVALRQGRTPAFAQMFMEQISDLTVLIPVRDDRRVAACVSSIDVLCPVLLVLNGATEVFERWVRAACPAANVVTTARVGLGHAYNVGLAACRSEHALLMDSDCLFTPGTIVKLRRGLKSAALSKGRVVFSHHGPLSRVIAAYRTYHTSDRISAYSPPLALSRTAVKLLLGYFFDEDLAWSEDFDFDLRVSQRGLRIAYDPTATVLHPALTLRQDLRAAFNYGMGYAVGVRKGVFPSPVKKGVWERAALHAKRFRTVRDSKGTAAAMYAVAWTEAYRAGFRSEGEE